VPSENVGPEPPIDGFLVRLQNVYGASLNGFFHSAH
jgi:hypothetical protein